ncbi:MAG: hypothetical protein Q9216_002372 [Gyalolechia sp. 2 TL-2023]
MAQKSFRKSQLVAFNNVAAGHDGVLSDRSGAVVVKPCSQAEINFYQSTAAHPHFALYIPTFIGTLTLNSDPQAAAALTQQTAATSLPDSSHAIPVSEAPSAVSHAPIVEKAWTPSNGGKITTDLAIVLENIAASFKKPNILDVKLGARLWDENAPPDKRAKLDKVSEETTSKPLGYRIAGMRTWQGSAVDDNAESGLSADGYKLYDKFYGRQFSADNVRQGFEDFFLLERDAVAKGPLREVINRSIEDLQGLQIVLEREESRMYSASLLFVYEGNRDALKAAFVAEKGDDKVPSNGADDGETHEEGDDDDEEGKPAVQALKLIDFAHAEWTPGQGKDENLLHGLTNVIEMFEGLVGTK